MLTCYLFVTHLQGLTWCVVFVYPRVTTLGQAGSFGVSMVVSGFYVELGSFIVVHVCPLVVQGRFYIAFLSPSQIQIRSQGDWLGSALVSI